MEERLEKIIYNWVEENFGKSEAADPSWSIKELAKELAKHKWEIRSMVQEEYDLEDIDDVADDLGVKLTKDEKSFALHRYRKIEDSNLETLEYIIKDIKEKE